MLIDSYHGKSYINIENITSMTIMKDREYNTELKKEIYFIQANSGLHDMRTLVFETKEKANTALLDIHKEIELLKSETVKDSNDYIQGFKDGTEYTLKLDKK